MIKQLTVLLLLASTCCTVWAKDVVKYSANILNEEGKGVKRARVYVEHRATNKDGMATIKTRPNRNIAIVKEGYQTLYYQVSTDPKQRIVLVPDGQKSPNIRPKLLQGLAPEPIYVVNGEYNPSFRAENYTDNDIVSVKSVIKWNGKLKKLFAGSDISPEDVIHRTVVFVTTASPIEFYKSKESSRYTFTITDTSGAPLQGATIYSHISQNQTDANGFVSFSAFSGSTILIREHLKHNDTIITLPAQAETINATVTTKAENPNSIMPTFNGGGVDNFRRWINGKVLNVADRYVQAHTVEVVAYFVINKQGRVCRVDILKKNDDNFAQYIKKTIYSSPRWTPGSQDGKTVKVSYTIPVSLRESEY